MKPRWIDQAGIDQTGAGPWEDLAAAYKLARARRVRDRSETAAAELRRATRGLVGALAARGSPAVIVRGIRYCLADGELYRAMVRDLEWRRTN